MGKLARHSERTRRRCREAVVGVLLCALLLMGLPALAPSALAEGSLVPSRLLTNNEADVSWEYELNSSGQAVITGCTIKEGVTGIDIPETLDGYTVVEVRNPIFQGNAQLKTVGFPSSVKKLTSELFAGCTNLETVMLTPMEELREIPSSCFAGCAKLNNVSIPSRVSIIGDAAFSGCTGLETFGFPPAGDLRSIGISAFENCTALKAIDLPPALRNIGMGAFARCESLTSINFRAAFMDTIDIAAFQGCTALEELHLPDKLTSMNQNAFAGCSKLKAVSYGKQLPQVVAANAFDGCPIEFMVFPTTKHGSEYREPSDTEKKRVGWKENDTAWLSVIYVENDTGNGDVQIFKIHATAAHSFIALPAAIGQHDIVSIVDNAAYGDANLTRVTFPANCKIASIGKWAFRECTSLQSVDIPKSVGVMGERAFQGCTSLQNVQFAAPSPLKTLSENAFRDCTSLQYIELPEGMETLLGYGFYNCTALETVYLPDTLKSIGAYAFSCDFDKHMPITYMRMPNSQDELTLPNDREFWSKWEVEHSTGSFKFGVTYGSYADAVYLDSRIVSESPSLTEISREYVQVGLEEQEGPPDNPSYTVKLSWDTTVNYDGGNRVFPKVTATRWLRTNPIESSNFVITPAQKEDGTFYDCSSIGTQKVRVSGRNELPYFKNSRILEYQIVASNLDNVQMKEIEPVCVWDDRKWEPHPTFYVDASKHDFLQDRDVDANGMYTLVEGQDYRIVKYEHNKLPTSQGASIQIEGMGNFQGVKSFTFPINPATLSTETTSANVADQEYTGVELTPVPTKVMLIDRDGNFTVELNKGNAQDYVIASYADNKNAGRATMTLKPVENCAWLTGQVDAHFNITQADLSKVTIEAVPNQTYTGLDITPELHVSLGTVELKQDVDYTVSWNNNRNVGTAKATITAKSSNFKGSQTIEFKIVPKAVTVTPNAASKEYGSPDPKLTAHVDGLAQGDAVAYSLTRETGENAGTYTISSSGEAKQGNYTVSFATGTFTVEPTSIAPATVASIPDCVFDGAAHEPQPQVTWNGRLLSAGTDYTVSYASNVHAGPAAATINGTGNFKDSKPASFTIKPLDISGTGCEVAMPFKVHTGQELTPHPTKVTAPGRDGATLTLVEGTDFEITGYSNSIDVGTGYANIRGLNDYRGERSDPFNIINDGDLSQGSIDPIPDQDYTGEPIEPTLHVYLKGVDMLLRRDVDYIASFEDNVEPGIAIPGGYSRARVTVTGIGDLHGSLTATFRILQPLAYTLVKGPDAPVKQGTGAVVEFEFKRSYDDDTTLDHLKSVLLNGEKLPETAYSTRRGSAIITLNASFIDSLEPGDFTLTAVFDDGQASADFAIEPPDPNPTPPGPVPPDPDPTPPGPDPPSPPEPEPEPSPDPNPNPNSNSSGSPTSNPDSRPHSTSTSSPKPAPATGAKANSIPTTGDTLRLIVAQLAIIALGANFLIVYARRRDRK